MRQRNKGVALAAIVMGLSAFPAHASDRAKTSHKPPAAPTAQQPAAPPDATAGGNSPVHRFFNAWGNGMQKGANAIGLDKDPLEGKLPQPKIKPLFGKSSEPDKDKR